MFVVDDVCMGGMDHQTGVTVLPSHTGPGWETIKYLSRMTWSYKSCCTSLSALTWPPSRVPPQSGDIGPCRWCCSHLQWEDCFLNISTFYNVYFTYCDVGSHSLLEPDALPWSWKLTSYNWGLSITECTGIIRKESFFGSLFLNRAQSLINIDVIHYYWTLLTGE